MGSGLQRSDQRNAHFYNVYCGRSNWTINFRYGTVDSSYIVRIIFVSCPSPLSVKFIMFFSVGYLADRFGRRTSFFLCIAFQSIFAVATSFAPSYVFFCIFRMLVGMTSSATFTVPFVLLLEITGPSHRALFSVLSSMTYTIGSLIFLLIAYYFRAWRDLALVTSLVALGLYCSLCWFFPESPRWLLSKCGRIFKLNFENEMFEKQLRLKNAALSVSEE